MWWLFIAPVLLYAEAPGELDLSPVGDRDVRELLEKSIVTLENLPDTALKCALKAQAASRAVGDDQGLARAAFLEGRAQVAKESYDAARKAYSLAGASYSVLADTNGLTDCMLDLAALEIRERQFSKALEHCRSAIELASGPQDIGRVSALRGLVFSELGSYDLALDNFFAALSAFSEIGYSVGMAESHHNIGDVKFKLENYDEAQSNYRDALRLYKKSNNEEGEMSSLCKLGMVELENGMQFAAIRSHRSALGLATKLQNANGIAGNDQFLGQIYLEQELPDSALSHFSRALANWRVSGGQKDVVGALLGLSRAHMQAGDLETALSVAEEAADSLAGTERLMSFKEKAYDLLSELYQENGEFELALEFRSKWGDILELLKEEDRRNKNTELQVRYEYEEAVSKLQLDKALQDARLLQEQEQRQQDQVILTWLVVLIILSILFLFFLLRSNKKSREANNLLQERTAEVEVKNEALSLAQKELERTNANLESLVDERTEALKQAVESLIKVNQDLDTFIYRASHDLLGPIARLKGLSVLLKESGAESAESPYLRLIDGVTTFMHRVLEKTILAHEMRTTTFHAEAVSVVELVNSVLPKLSQIPGIEEPVVHLHNKVSGKVQLDPNLTRIILENVLENAILFRADPKNPKPEVELNVYRKKGVLVIEAEDKGIGIPKEIQSEVFNIFFRGSERSKGNGLGLFMVKTAAERMEGTVRLESKEGEFTRIRIEIPLPEAA